MSFLDKKETLEAKMFSLLVSACVRSCVSEDGITVSLIDTLAAFSINPSGISGTLMRGYRTTSD